ncbi:hypothetical protein [Streptomyces sp. RKAG337]|uniref:hypothetical protein n=1 Tax=Streptomyces sp. RKAG337 TaxID=2893404 RepID=UPI0020331D8E|nr:hypothetical protein [Streptomyces sp. RKAG337]MCM2425180.1 hypothetical protein [Streptomyces sp. RKAG337]
MRRQLLGVAVATALAWVTLSAPAATATQSTDAEVHAFLYNKTRHSLTLKVEHNTRGCTYVHPTQQVPPGGYTAWLVETCGDINIDGYVTYTIDNTGGQGYAYTHWFATAGGQPSYDAQAGGQFTMGVTHPGNEVDYTLNCLIPHC